MNGLVKGGKKSIKDFNKKKKPSGIKKNQSKAAENQSKKALKKLQVATGAALQVNKKPKVTGFRGQKEKKESQKK